MGKKSIIWVIIILVLLGILFAWPAISNPARGKISAWHDEGIDCLPSHTRAELHIHPTLTITVDGELEVIPSNTGIVRGCMAEVHTHDASGTIHIESALAVKDFTLSQFLFIYEKPFVREGYSMKMMVDGVESNAGEGLVLKDKQQIKLDYIKE